MSSRIGKWLTATVALGICLSLGLVTVASAGSPQAADTEQINLKIREEGWENSQVMRTLHFLTDRYGPRLTGSPNYENSAKWAIQQMAEWGFENAHLEPFDFGRPGWVNERFSVHMIAPVKDSLDGEVLAWTPSTDGVITASVFHVIPPEEPTQEELAAFLDGIRSDVAGKIVLVGDHRDVGVSFDAPAKRRDDEELRRQYDPDAEQQAGGGRGGQRGPQQEPDPNVVPARQVAREIDQLLIDHGAVVRFNDAARAHGQVRAFGASATTQSLPTGILRNEDFGRIARLIEFGDPVVLEVEIVNRDYEPGRTVHNAVAEIPGTDLADQVILLGGHLDSWHAATGATDNATGVSVMMEAARILKDIGVQPRRTIRVALWAGEEQGLLGSQAYVEQHYGTAEDPKPEFDNFNGYFNVDSGTGRVRGLSVFGPPEAATVLREALAPFEDLGVMGAMASTSRRRGGTDVTAFNAAGLPGIGVSQDPIEYFTHTWHTNLDTYERAIEDDLKSTAIVVAATIYQLAMRDEMLPRFSAADMPPPAGSGR